MTNPNFNSDEMAEGWQAARRGEPFSQWTSIPWQRGWMLERRQAAASTLSPETYARLDHLLGTLAALCTAIGRSGPLAVDLAQAVAFQALDGVDVGGDQAPIPAPAPPGPATFSPV